MERYALNQTTQRLSHIVLKGGARGKKMEDRLEGTKKKTKRGVERNKYNSTTNRC